MFPPINHFHQLLVCSVFKTYHVSPFFLFFQIFLIFLFRSITQTFFKTTHKTEVITIEKKRETINDEIQYMIDKTINQQAQPELVTITKIYEDDYVDCVTENDETLECIPVIKRSNLQVDDDGILFLLSNEMYYVIA